MVKLYNMEALIAIQKPQMFFNNFVKSFNNIKEASKSVEFSIRNKKINEYFKAIHWTEKKVSA